MARDTSLTYSLYGKDVSASKAMQNVGHHVKKVGLAFAAAGVAAAAFAADAVKAAAEDEASQVKLAVALKNTAGATKSQIASTEKLISKMQLTYGIADDKLRPAFANLTRATHSVSKSSKLMNLAMDISAGTGKDLESVSMALAKAYTGNFGAITRLGIPLDKSIIKHKDLKKMLEILSGTFNGSAKKASETMAGKYAIITQNLNETKESIGKALMPTVQKMAEYVLNTVVPNLQSFVGVFTGDKGINSAMHDGTIKAHNWALKAKEVGQWFVDHKDSIETVAKLLASMFIGIKVGGLISALGSLVTPFFTLATAAATAAGAEAAATGGGTWWAAAPAVVAIGTTFGIAKLIGAFDKQSQEGLLPENMTPTQVQKSEAAERKRKQKESARIKKELGIDKTWMSPSHVLYTWDANREEWWVLATGENGTYRDYSNPHPKGAPRAVGGSVVRGLSYTVGERGPEQFTPTTTGRITPNGLGVGGGVNVTVNVRGHVTAERDLAITVRDQIAQLMRRRGVDPGILGV